MEKITQKQAIKIAKWLGFKVAPCDDEHAFFWFHPKYKLNLEAQGDSGEADLINWLSSPEGQMAMMDRLIQLFRDSSKYEGVEIFVSKEGAICVWIDCVEGINGCHLKGKATTYEHALKLAILEMIEDDKN